MWPTDRLQRLIGIEHPIVQAPMAGASTPAMAAAVSNAGGLGSLGCALMAPQQLRDVARDVAAATNRPINFNFFAHSDPDLVGYDASPMRAALQSLYSEFDLGAVPPLPSMTSSFGGEMLEALLACAPKIVSFHFGLPPPTVVVALKAIGATLIGTATSVAEAHVLEAGGMDAIVAQGAEAGGHRGTFIGDPAANDMGTLVLTPLIVDAVSVPVIAAGGIFDGRGVAAAFMLGASGAQIGTAFLRSPESAAPTAHKQALAATPDNSTRLTRVFTGRAARSIRNRLSEELAPLEAEAAPFPLQRFWTGPLSAAAATRGNAADFLPLWSGQAGPRVGEAPSAHVFRAICEEALALLA